MYVPAHFAVTDPAQIAEMVDGAQSADLITFDGTRPVATLLPVIWERPPVVGGTAAGDTGGSGLGRLLGHLALANDQWRTAQPGAQALAIVHGPQAYISPSWYESTTRHGRVVPTWNYEQVQLTGDVAFRRDPEWLRDLVTRLTRRHEDGRERPWTVGDAPPDYISGQLRGIVGVELTVTAVTAKRKLSQNRDRADRAGAIAGLRAEPGAEPAAVATLMDELMSGPGTPD